jgi:hypothetical protein
MKTNEHQCYPVFETNQILTSTHLNRMREYLDTENRLTRNKLFGFGIVCGLKVKMNSPGSIIISKGYGITTDGYLLALDKNKEFTRYKKYAFPKEQEFEFIKLSKDNDVFEIFEENTTTTGTSLLTEKIAGILKDKVVVMFLELSEETLQSCTGSSCDNKGKKKNCTLRILLLNKSCAIEEQKFIDSFDGKYSLPELTIQRFRLYPLVKSIKKFEKDVELNETFDLAEDKFELVKDVVSKAKYVQEVEDIKIVEDFYGRINKYDYVFRLYNILITAELKSNIIGALKKCYEVYEPFLKCDYETNPFDKCEEIFEDIIKKNVSDIQYLWDFFSELIKAYNEFREKAFDLLTGCSPDIEHFPQHLLLGLIENPTTFNSQKFRYPFFQTPVYNNMAERINEVKHLFKRMVIMVSDFSVPDPQNCKMAIIPSKEKEKYLSEWAIPFYYFGKGESSKINEAWNYNFYKRRRSNQIFSYFSNYYNSADEWIKNPLNYVHDDYPFYRIEGIHGKASEAAFKEIENKRKTFNLPFKAIVLNLEKDTSKISLNYDKLFYDLQEEYFFQRGKIISLINDIIDYYELLIPAESNIVAESDVVSIKEEDIKNLSTQISSNEESFAKVVDSEKIFVKVDVSEESSEKITESKNIFTKIGNSGESSTKTNSKENLQKKVKMIFSCLNSLTNILDPCLQKFDYEAFKAAYKNLLEITLKFLVVDQELLKTLFYKMKETSYVRDLEVGNKLLNLFAKLVFKLIDGLCYTKILRIYFGYKRREYFLLINHLSIFSNFIKKHTGIEHYAGVYKGGTFILLCQDNKVVADFSLPYFCCMEDYSIPPCDNSDTLRNIKIKPFAHPDIVVTLKNKPVPVYFLNNDDGFHGCDIEFAKIISEPKNGKIKLSENKNEIVYTPKDGFLGVDTFTYSIRNIYNNLEDEGTVTIIVLEKPIKANDDEAKTTSLESINIRISDNDVYLENSEFSFTETDDNKLVTKNGNTFTLKRDRKGWFMQFTPDRAFGGAESCRYKITSDCGKDEATVTVWVEYIEIIEAVDDVASTTSDQPIWIKVLDNDIHPAGSQIKFIDSDENKIITNNKNTFEIKECKGESYIYFTPVRSFSGSESCRYKIVYGDRSDEALVTVTVTYVPPPLEAKDKTYTVKCNIPLEMNVLDDAQFDSAKLFELLFYGIEPARGILDNTPMQMIKTERGADVFLVVPQIGIPFFKYFPYSNEQDSLKYQIKQGDSVSTATVSVNIAANPNPVLTVSGTITAYGQPLPVCWTIIKDPNISFITADNDKSKIVISNEYTPEIIVSDQNGKYVRNSKEDLRGKTLIFISKEYGPKEVIICNSTIDVDLSNYPGGYSGIERPATIAITDGITIGSVGSGNITGTTVGGVVLDSTVAISNIASNAGDIIYDSSNTVLNTNIDNSLNFANYIKTDGGTITANLNNETTVNELTTKFNDTVNPIVAEIQTYNEKAAMGTVTEEETVANTANVELLKTNVGTLINTISIANTDIVANGSVATFIANDLTNKLTVIKESDLKLTSTVSPTITISTTKPVLAGVVSLITK